MPESFEDLKARTLLAEDVFDLIYIDRTAVELMGDHRLLQITLYFSPMFKPERVYASRFLVDPDAALAEGLCTAEQAEFVKTVVHEDPETQPSAKEDTQP